MKLKLVGGEHLRIIKLSVYPFQGGDWWETGGKAYRDNVFKYGVTVRPMHEDDRSALRKANSFNNLYISCILPDENGNYGGIMPLTKGVIFELWEEP